MGIRKDQYIGLNERVEELVKGTPVCVYVEVTTRVYPDGRHEEQEPKPVYESSVKREEHDVIHGAWTDMVAPLHKYTFPDGRVYFEAIQAAPWSSGPCYFIALKDERGEWVPESRWSDEEIEASL